MTDQCKNCTLKGDWPKCQEADCFHHANWGWKQLKTELDHSRMAAESEAKRGDELKAELDQMTARVAQLESFIKDTIDPRSPCGPAADTLLNETPAASLKSIQADTLDEFYNNEVFVWNRALSTPEISLVYEFTEIVIKALNNKAAALREDKAMNFERIGKSSDWSSDCGEFHITACNDNLNGAYWPTKKIEDGRFRCLTKDSTNWNDAKKVCESFNAPCGSCGQADTGQTGEHPCIDCGLPMEHDSALREGE